VQACCGSEQRAQIWLREIQRKTRKKYTAEDKIRIILEGLHGEENVNLDNFFFPERLEQAIGDFVNDFN